MFAGADNANERSVTTLGVVKSDRRSYTTYKWELSFDLCGESLIASALHSIRELLESFCQLHRGLLFI